MCDTNKSSLINRFRLTRLLYVKSYLNLPFPGPRMRALFKTTAKVAVLWITAAQRGLIFPKAPRSIAVELTRMVAVKF